MSGEGQGETLRVVVVEDNAFFLRGLVRVLARQGFRVVGTAVSGEQAVEVVRESRPHVVMMDLHLPEMDGAATTERLMRHPSPPAVVMLTVSDHGGDLQRALRAGASGYLLKDASSEQIATAIRGAAEGHAPLSEPMAKRLVEQVREPPSRVNDADSLELSDRELMVLRLLAKGLGNNEIADSLGISSHTVKSHVSTLLAKLGVENRVQAATEAVRRGYI